MKRIQFKYIIKSFFASLLLMGLSVNVALALPQQGDEVNAECTALKRVPAAPYNGSNCTICHTAGFAGGPGTGRNKYNEYFNKNIKSSLNYFCKAPPSNTPPTADAGGPYSADTGVSIKFDGTGSKDADGDQLTYKWTFGDGASGSGATPSHAYANAGSYTVKVTVSDGSASASASATAKITDLTPPPPADNIAPVLGMIGDWTVTVGTDVVIPLSATDADGDALTFSTMGLPSDLMLTDNGDGTGSLSGMPASVGAYDITVKVTDDGVPSLMDQELFTLKVVEDAPPPVNDIEITARAEWSPRRKILYVVKGLVLSEDDDDDESTCSVLMGQKVVVTNEAGKTLATKSLNCEGRFRIRKKMNRRDITCYVTVSAAGESIDLKVGNVSKEKCGNVK